MLRWSGSTPRRFGDIAALLAAGLLSRVEGGGVVFPYEAVKVELVFKAA